MPNNAELVVPIAEQEDEGKENQVAEKRQIKDAERLRPRPGIFEALSAKVKTTPKKGAGKEKTLAPEKVDLEKSLLIPVKV